MGLECPDRTLSLVPTMHIWGHKLKCGLPGDGDGMLVGCTSLIVQDLEINCKTAGCQSGHDIIVGCNAMLVAPGLEGLLEDEITIGVIGCHDILVAQMGLDWETAHIICVELADGLNMDEYFIGRSIRGDGWL
jgi:hypothetical protein